MRVKLLFEKLTITKRNALKHKNFAGDISESSSEVAATIALVLFIALISSRYGQVSLPLPQEAHGEIPPRYLKFFEMSLDGFLVK